jgi:acetyltransferase-like isoleucine patch superfamily enzyme
MPGITIGDHVIIGAGAVVMTNIPSNVSGTAIPSTNSLSVR